MDGADGGGASADDSGEGAAEAVDKQPVARYALARPSMAAGGGDDGQQQGGDLEAEDDSSDEEDGDDDDGDNADVLLRCA